MGLELGAWVSLWWDRVLSSTAQDAACQSTTEMVFSLRWSSDLNEKVPLALRTTSSPHDTLTRDEMRGMSRVCIGKA